MAALPVGLWIRIGEVASQPGCTMTSRYQELMNEGRGSKDLLEQKAPEPSLDEEATA